MKQQNKELNEKIDLFLSNHRSAINKEGWDIEYNKGYPAYYVTPIGWSNIVKMHILSEKYGFKVTTSYVIIDFDMRKYNENKHLLSAQELGLL